MQGIIWLASYPKSGNTWMRAFLANLFAGEKDPVSFERMSKFISGEPMAIWYTKMFGDSFPIHDDTQVMNKRRIVQSNLAASTQVPIFLKTHSYLGQVNGQEIFNMDVTLGAIVIVRNPLDVVISAAPHFNLSIDETIKMMADEQMKSERSDKMVVEKVTDWSTHTLSWTQHPNPALLVLRYEDMLDNQVQSFTKVTRFIKSKKSKKEILRAIKNSSFKSLQVQEQKDGFSERPDHNQNFFRKGEAGQWRSVLTKDQIRKIIDRHHEQMERFDYIPSDFS